MTDLRTAAQQALEALEMHVPQYLKDRGYPPITALKAALAEPVQEPVAHSVVAGALFDFMGWLTSRKKRIVLSSADDASPAVEAITEFAKMRGLSLDDAKVQDWNAAPPQPPAEPVQEPVCDVIDGRGEVDWISFVPPAGTPLYAAPPQRKPLSEEEIDNIWDSEKAFADIYAITRAIERAHGIT